MRLKKTRILIVAGLLFFLAFGCCSRNDVLCLELTEITVQAASGKIFPEDLSYSIYWTTGEMSGTVNHYLNRSEELTFTIDEDLSGTNAVDVTFYADNEPIAERDSLAMNWKTTICNNYNGPAWCEDEEVSNASPKLVLDESEW